jgi:hypothetical protein
MDQDSKGDDRPKFGKWLLATVLICWLSAAIFVLAAGFVMSDYSDCRGDLRFGSDPCADNSRLFLTDFLACSAFALVLSSVILPIVLYAQRKRAEPESIIS